ncbi:MAG: phage minor capsid protein, partial [Ruminococcus sp.]|nr:phage minor capsid protein [Ruminococcus sp.]
KENGADITSAVDWQLHRLYELGKTDKEIKDEIQKALNLSDEEIDRVYSDVLKESYTRDKTLYEDMGQGFIPYKDNEELKQLVSAVNQQTKNECRNITQSLGFAKKQPNGKITYTPLGDFYRDKLDSGLMEIATGITDYNTVLNRLVSEMTNSGMRWVDYESGWSNRVDVACRRALLTGYNQVVGKVNEDNAEKLGTEYFEVSYHSGARPTHQVWQGRVYSKAQLETVCGLGTVTGLCGANCYHSYSPFFPGISVRTYTDEELDRMNAEDNIPKEYNGKQYTKYEALQRQRRLETTMRAERQKINLLIQGGADEDDILSAKVRYNGTSDEYVKFSRAMELPQQRQRVTVDGLGNIGNIKKQKTVNISGAKPVEKSAESGIINTGSVSGALNPYSKEAGEHAEKYYESVRHMTTDTLRIAEATNLRKEKIDKIKNHIFIKEHDLSNGHRRFDPSYDMAQSWQRLISGKYEEKDMILLKHEYAELRYMEKGLQQHDAHIKASKRYNYAKYCD